MTQTPENMSTSPVVDDACVVLKLPHYRLVGDDVFFMISSRPALRLSPGEAAVWRAIDAPASMATLRACFGAQADLAVGNFVRHGACMVATAPPSTARRRVLVIEPHSDDAALSVGATMWMRRNEIEFTVATVASRSNFTSYFRIDREYFDVDEVTGLRNAEAALYMRLLNGHHIAVGLPEATLRYRDANWSRDWYRRHKVSVSANNNHRVEPSELEATKAAMRALLAGSSFDEVWIPLGVGTHSDHEVTRNACLSVLIEDPTLLEGCSILLYQDVPYDAHFAAHTDAIVAGLRASGAVLEPTTVPIDAAFDDKVRLLSVFASQFKVDSILAGVRDSAHANAGGHPMAEHLWRLERRPDSLDMLDLYIDRAEATQVCEQIRPRLAAFQKARLIRLLVLMPAGRWSADMRYLMQVFPDANFEVHAAPAALAEIGEFAAPRIRVIPAGEGGKGWARLILRLMVQRPAPTVLVSSVRGFAQARIAAKLLPGSRSIVAATMDHLVIGLRQALQPEGGAPHCEANR